jgi:hypothetical protein
VLASRLAGTAVRMDCHGNQPRLPSGMARATAATGLHGVSRVLFFLEEAAEGLLPVLPGLAPAPVGWRIVRERGKQQLVGSVAPQPSHRGQPTPHTRPTLEDDGGRSFITGRTRFRFWTMTGGFGDPDSRH